MERMEEMEEMETKRADYRRPIGWPILPGVETPPIVGDESHMNVINRKHFYSARSDPATGVVTRLFRPTAEKRLVNES